MKRRVISFALMLAVLISLFSITASAWTEGGTCGAQGDNLTWTLDTETGTLTISGSGAMANYSELYDIPWYYDDVNKIIIGAGVTSVNIETIFICDGLEEISVEAENSFYCDVGGILFTKDQSALLMFPAACNQKQYQIPEGVVAIGEYAFYGNRRLKEVTVSDSVTTIGNQAFSYCYSLTTVTMGDNVTDVGYGVFSGSDFLSTVVFGKGLTVIGQGMFKDCTYLEEMVIPDGITEIGWYAFQNCTDLTTVTIPNSVTSIGKYGFDGCTALTDVYYYGTAAQWNAIKNGTYNYRLTSATLHYVQTVYTPAEYGNHTVSDVCPKYGETLWTETEDCVDENADNFCDLCGGDLYCAHSGDTITVSTPNAPADGQVTHRVTLNCAICKKEVLEEVLNKEVCTFSDGVCTECGRKELDFFAVSGSNMTLGNELVVNVLIKQSDVTATGLTAYVTHHAETGDTVYEFPQDEWETYANRYYKFPVAVAAAQMTDQVSIEIRDADNDVYNYAYATSVRDYVDRVYASNSDTVKTLMVDMLNYGAAAQDHFGYRTKLPANLGLTFAQQAMATDAVECTDIRVKGLNYVGSNLSLEDRILLNFFFTGVENDADLAQMSAVVSFTGVLGNKIMETVAVEKLLNKYAGVVVDQIVLADAVCPVSVTLYNADGTLYGYATDSVESYNARQNPNGTNELYTNIMKFAAAALTYKNS